MDTYDLVVGLGRSGQAMAKFLAKQGKNVMATDLNPDLASVETELNRLGIGTRIGSHDHDLFNHAQTIYMSPGIPLTIPYIRQAAERNIPVTGELDLFGAHNTLPVIAVTGTNGKTTTTTLIGEMLTASGLTPFVGGNIGTPMLDALMSGQQYDCMVIEISSFQLDLARTFRPAIGVLLNITPDHMDRYADFNAYADSKWSLFSNQTAADTAIVNTRIPDHQARLASLHSIPLIFLSDMETGTAHGAGFDSHDPDMNTLFIRMPRKEYQFNLATSHLVGAHNKENIAAAALACLAAGGSDDGIQKTIDAFVPMAHRMEYVATVQGVAFYNDSKATNPDAVIRAIDCFKDNIILILGGREKDTDFTELLPAMDPAVKTVIAIGESKEKIKTVFNGRYPVKDAATMNDAVNMAFNLASPGDTVLLAPACASFDMYANYKDRGEDFKARVKDMEHR